MPGKGAFKRCVEHVKSQGSASDPRAVCASAGRRKYGAKKFAAMAKTGRKRAARKNAKLSANERALFGAGKKLAMAKAAPVVALLNKGRRNPEAAAVAAFEDFHGYTPGEILEFTRKHHYHEFTWAVGKLVSMVIQTPKNQGSWDVTLKNFKGAILTANEPPECKKKPTQLFVEGGDQSVDLAKFGIKDEHELQYLGVWMDVVYFARKDHLGDDGGIANYEHKFGTKELSFSWRKKVARPHIVYDVRNEELMIAGGGYEIPAEGIDG